MSIMALGGFMNQTNVFVKKPNGSFLIMAHSCGMASSLHVFPPADRNRVSGGAVSGLGNAIMSEGAREDGGHYAAGASSA